MRKLGAILLVAGLLAITGYMIYFFIVAPDMPMVIRISVPVVTLGVTLLLTSLIWERRRTAKEEDFKEVDK